MVGDYLLELASADIVPARAGGPTYLETIEEMDGDLAKVIEDFTRAVDVEALRFAKKSGKLSLCRSDDSLISVVSCRSSRKSATRARAFG